jgi:hypothetical protein
LSLIGPFCEKFGKGSLEKIIFDVFIFLVERYGCIVASGDVFIEHSSINNYDSVQSSAIYSAGHIWLKYCYFKNLSSQQNTIYATKNITARNYDRFLSRLNFCQIQNTDLKNG